MAKKDVDPNTRKGKRAAIAKLESDNPEGLTEKPHNTLFGKPAAAAAKKRASQGEEAEQQASKKQKTSQRAPIQKGDPAAAAVDRAKKGAAKGKPVSAVTKKGADKGSKSAGPSGGAGNKSARPHADAVERSTKIWERLRTDKTGADERRQLIDEVLQLFQSTMFEVLQKHDAARVIQSCFKQGDPSQRDALMASLKGQLYQLARSHYGHFLLLSVVRHGTAAHKQQLMAELKGHAAELLVHAEGSAVLQLVYTDVATAQQKHSFYRELWGVEFGLLLSGKDAKEPELTSLGALFESDPLAKPRVLKRMEILLSKAARKGLTMTTLVQRGMAELLEHGEPAQRAELVSVMRESAVHIMHTRDGARIACGCLRHGARRLAPRRGRRVVRGRGRS